MEEEDEKGQPLEDGEEYSMLLVLDRLESLREDLDEAGFSTLREVEAALALTVPTNPASPDAFLDERRALLTEIREEMLDLGLDNYQQLNDQIRLMHQQLDEAND